MAIYKLRAECFNDVMKVVEAFEDMKIDIQVLEIVAMDNIAPDYEFKFGTILSLLGVASILHHIPDNHVMSQTVDYVEKYTGIR